MVSASVCFYFCFCFSGLCHWRLKVFRRLVISYFLLCVLVLHIVLAFFLISPFPLCLSLSLKKQYCFWKVWNKVELLSTVEDTVSVYTTNSCPASLFISLSTSLSLSLSSACEWQHMCWGTWEGRCWNSNPLPYHCETYPSHGQGGAVTDKRWERKEER